MKYYMKTINEIIYERIMEKMFTDTDISRSTDIRRSEINYFICAPRMSIFNLTITFTIRMMAFLWGALHVLS